MLFRKKTPEPSRTRRAVQPQPSRSVVFSYHANRTIRPGATVRDVQEARPAPAKTPQVWRRQLSVYGGLALMLVVLWFSMRLDARPHIVPVGAQQNAIFLRQTSVYEAAAMRALSSPGNRNKLTVNTDNVAKELTRSFPELSAVSVSLPFMGSRPTVYIQPATPRLLLSTNSGLYVVDGTGRALMSANQVAELDSLELPVVTDQSGLAIRTGQVVLPRATVGFISEVVGQLQAKQLEIQSLTLPAGANELHVRMQGAGYYVKYNVHGVAREEAGAYLALKERLQKDNKTPKEYIDVRVEGRAYYK